MLSLNVRLTLLACLLLHGSLPLAAATIRVPEDAATIQAGIDAAVNGDQVVVADGVWGGEGNQELDFSGKAITVCSANGPENCTINCSMEFSHRGFVFDDGEGRDAVVQGFTLIRGAGSSYGAAVVCIDASPTITGNRFTDNPYSLIGTGDCSPLITGNTFSANYQGLGFTNGCTAEVVGNIISDGFGGGIRCNGADVLIDGNCIENNRGDVGIDCEDCSPTIVNNIIRFNDGDAWGGGIGIHDGSPTIMNNLIEGNTARYCGGGIGLFDDGIPLIVNNTIIGNEADAGWGGGGIGLHQSWSSAIIRNCIIRGNSPDEIWEDSGHVTFDVSYSNIEGGWAGSGNIDADPLFCVGPNGDHYLSQTAAGQAVNSPCVDAGSPADDSPGGTTRTDSAPDGGVVDMGFHFDYWTGSGDPPETWILSGPSGDCNSPVLNFLISGEDGEDPPSSLLFSYRLDAGEWSPWSAATLITIRDVAEGVHTFEARAMDSSGYIDPTPVTSTFSYTRWSGGVPWSNLATGPGPGAINPTLVRTPHAEWEAYGVARYGVNVACGNLDGSGLDEVITGPGPGAVFGPHVRGWNVDGNPLPGVSFIAYGTLKYGVNVAAGDLDGDGSDEIITGAGPGAVFGPHVRGWNVDGGPASPMAGISYFAYGTLKYGVNVAAGDLDGDGRDEIITGAGPGAVFGPHVRGWRYQGGAASPMPSVSFLAYGTNKFGVNVAAGDLDDDGIDEIITGPGPGAIFGAHVRAWEYDGTISPMPGVNFFAFDTDYGAVVSAGDVDNDGIDELITAVGPHPGLETHIKAWNADGGSVSLVEAMDTLAYDTWMTHGCRIAGGNLN